MQNRKIITANLLNFNSKILLEKITILKIFKSVILLSVILLIGACTVGNWNICGPQTPRANCDKEAYERLTNPKSLRDRWEKPEMTIEQRKEDWIACGGSSIGWYDNPHIPNGTTQQYNYESRQIHSSIQICMLSKGYKWSEPCLDNEIQREWPACQKK